MSGLPTSFAMPRGRWCGSSAHFRELFRVALQVVERVGGQFPGSEFLSMVETANNGLWHAIDTFPGGTADDFVRHVEQAVEVYLNRHGSCSQ